MIDNKAAEDKIIAVLIDDVAYGHMENISDCPIGLIDAATLLPQLQTLQTKFSPR